MKNDSPSLTISDAFNDPLRMKGLINQAGPVKQSGSGLYRNMPVTSALWALVRKIKRLEAQMTDADVAVTNLSAMLDQKANIIDARDHRIEAMQETLNDFGVRYKNEIDDLQRRLRNQDLRIEKLHTWIVDKVMDGELS